MHRVLHKSLEYNEQLQYHLIPASFEEAMHSVTTSAWSRRSDRSSRHWILVLGPSVSTEMPLTSLLLSKPLDILPWKFASIWNQNLGIIQFHNPETKFRLTCQASICFSPKISNPRWTTGEGQGPVQGERPSRRGGNKEWQVDLGPWPPCST